MLIRNPASSREFHAVSLRSTIISFVIDDEKYDMQPATFHISCWRFMQLMFCAANELNANHLQVCMPAIPMFYNYSFRKTMQNPIMRSK